MGWLLAEDPRNRIASRRITTKLGEASFKAPTFATSDGVSVSVGLMQREAATMGEIRQPVVGSVAGASPSGSTFAGGGDDGV